jgi:hypothetical protein
MTGRHQPIGEKLFTQILTKVCKYKLGKSHKVNTYKGHVISRPDLGTGDFYKNCIWNIGGPSIELDFCFPESQWDIEIDGHFHIQPNQITKDVIRDVRLKENGWFITRIPNECVINIFSKLLETKNFYFDTQSLNISYPYQFMRKI